MPLLMMSRCCHVSIVIAMWTYLPPMERKVSQMPGRAPGIAPTMDDGSHKGGSACCCETVHSKLFPTGIVVENGAFHLFDQVGDGDAARAGICAVKDGATAPDAGALSQDAKPFLCSLVPAVEDEAVSIDDRGRADPIGIAPYGGAGTCTGAAENAFCALVVTLALRGALQALRPWLIVIGNQVGLDVFIFVKERIHIDDQVFDDWETKHRLDGHFIANIAHKHLAGQAVTTIDTHGIRTTHAMRAGAAVGKGTVHSPFDGVHGVQQAVDGVSFHAIFGPIWFLILFRVEAFNAHQHIHGLPP